eukprot:CAMPEP_0115132342 /NCGR_PEP_ID=MMETSP0227-20121206/53680_1 /TAXON_ID=89957 /ORGANISM="Polarella glacialis, Strain CCMP 1383" /LENGTH=200 /DNA_ID=CAMNT_0002538085 /DNA_START=60 /DNA_END=662 /DNA_ORIENTATION=-
MSSSSVPMLRQRRSPCLLVLGAGFALTCVIRGSSGLSFAPGPSAGDALPTRRVALGGVLPVLMGAGVLPDAASAIPRVTDRFEYINRRKLELVPVFKQGLDYLNKYGVDERMMIFLPRMIRKMSIYANVNSGSEAPDKVTRKMEADTDRFEKAVKAKDIPAALEAFEQYRLDTPKGIAFFDFNIPSTWNPPEDVQLPSEA